MGDSRIVMSLVFGIFGAVFLYMLWRDIVSLRRRRKFNTIALRRHHPRLMPTAIGVLGCAGLALGVLLIRV